MTVDRKVLSLCYDLNMCSSCPDATFDNVMSVMLKFILFVCYDALLSCGCVVRSCFGITLAGE